MKDNKITAHLALLGANLIYGINYSIAKDVMGQYVQPFGFILSRVIGATLLFWLAHSLFYIEKVEKKDLPKLFLLGLFGVAINQLLFFKGLNITTPINASIIMTSNPILVLIAANFLLKEQLTLYKITGIFLGLTGALMLLLLKDDFSIGSQTWKGDAMVFLNAASYGVYLVMVKPLMQKYKPITVIKWVFLFGLIIVFPFGINEFLQINFSLFPTKIWLEFLFVIVATTFLAYLFNIYALKRVSPSVVSTYIYTQPLIAGLFAILMQQDNINWVKILSAILIFTGVYLVSKRN
jgi:drug/metabolite transporter (DMT)-like permease